MESKSREPHGTLNLMTKSTWIPQINQEKPGKQLEMHPELKLLSKNDSKKSTMPWLLRTTPETPLLLTIRNGMMLLLEST